MGMGRMAFTSARSPKAGASFRLELIIDANHPHPTPDNSDSDPFREND
jgi:hypothetical protein